MGNNANGMGTGKALLLTIGIMLCIGWIISLGTPKCQKSGCHNDAKAGSRYCYLHDNSYYTHKSYSSSYTGSSAGSSTSKDSGSSSGSGNSATTGSQSSSSSVSSSTKNNERYEDTYDKGYEDVYEDDDYDIDRYNSDSDYANGVDDAMDDLEEEGEEW